MNRLQSLFGRKNTNLLAVYATAGYPQASSTIPVIKSLSDAGVDIIELGVPFSDPMADGVVIQESSAQAISQGMTVSKLLDDVAQVRTQGVEETPIVLMGYLNPFMCYGIERLLRQAKRAGVDALIIPDLPFKEYLEEYQPLCRELDLPMIMMITPETEPERIRLIDSHCDGFIYMVSAAGTTGTRQRFDDAQKAYFKRVNDMGLTHHRLIGFGISNPGTCCDAMTYSSGAIVGSLFIKCLKAHPSSPHEAVAQLMATLFSNP